MARHPDRSEALRLHARAAQAEGRFAEAEAAYAAAVEADPQSHAAHHDRGGFYTLTGRLQLAETSLRAAHAITPDHAATRHALGIVLLTQGRYAEGWDLYDARHAITERGLRKPALPYPEWRGEDPKGQRILIFPEQGFGDEIQFSRFAPWVAARGAAVTLLCHPALAALFAESFPGVQVLPASGAVEFPDPDYWVMSGSVTGRSGLAPEALPSAPYLKADPAPRTSGGVGIVVRGNPAHANDANRSLSPAAAQRLLALPGAVSLEPGDTGATDFAQTAAIIAGLDRVIAVDTAVAHLAAAMGKPTWILLPRLMVDWRWMEDRADSPWYPAARLFRQPNPGDWESVLAEVFAALEA